MKEKLIILIEDKVKETEKEIDSYNESDKTKKVLKEKMLNCKKQLKNGLIYSACRKIIK